LFVFMVLPMVTAQFTKEEFQQLAWQQKIFFGGNFGLMFGTYTDIEISPVIGYRLTRNLSFAAGPKYRYYKEPIVYYNTLGQPVKYVLEGHIYGGRSYFQIHFIRDINDFIPIGLHAGLFGHAEYEILSLENEDFRPQSGESGRYTLHTVFVGGGLRVPIGERAAFSLMVLWNATESYDSPYPSPVIRYGFTF